MLSGLRAAVTATLVAACSASQQWTRHREATVLPHTARHGYTTLHVFNQNDEDVRVALVRSGTSIYVGRVGAFSFRSFSLSPAETGAFGDLTLAMQTLASGRQHVVELVGFEPGQEIWSLFPSETGTGGEQHTAHKNGSISHDGSSDPRAEILIRAGNNCQ